LLSDPMMPLIVLVAFASVAGIGWVFVGGKPQASKKRMKAVAGRGPMRGKRQTAALDAGAQRRRQVQETLKELEDKQKKARKASLSLKARLEQSGLAISVKTFWLISAGAGLFGGLLPLVIWQKPVVAAAMAIALGLGLPRWVVGFLRAGRLKKFAEEFANAIDVIVRGVKAGLPLNECLKIIAKEAPTPVREEFAQLVEGLSLGVSLDEGLKRMYDRMPLPELNFFGVVLAIQQKTGGNLAEALGNLSGVIRSRKMMREKIQAYSSEAKASAFIIGAMPPGVCGLVYVTAPEYMSMMFTESMGRLMLICGVVWMCVGIFVMRKMINFKF
jgi:tight adherence protein B